MILESAEKKPAGPDRPAAAGTRLGSRDKLTLARQLARLKVDVIEAGYPASSPEDFESVQLIAREVAGPAICALSRAVRPDIEACGKALAKAKKPRIHTGIGASDIHVILPAGRGAKVSARVFADFIATQVRELEAEFPWEETLPA